MRVRSPLAMGLLALAGVREAMAGYLSLSMTQPVQCGTATIQFSGDNGPYHLLLTPTDFVRYGHNVWVPSINTTSNQYSLLIRLPANLEFLLTMWGESGIEYAGTTSVMTVGASPTNDTSCFLTDQQILSLYSFSFDIADTSDGYPPQCANLSMSWPTSLESNVTSDVSSSSSAGSSLTASVSVSSAAAPSSTATPTGISGRSDSEIMMLERDDSSSAHNGNTTKPPTMFGIIPLGNSFSIPITYSPKSRYAKTLPADSISDTPTTWTSQGVTHLNWTVDMAKGTRFILVAGIGSDMQWASGGSSKMLTVGQGVTGCTGSERNGQSGAPSITASSQATSTDLGSGGGTPGHFNPVSRTVVACVVSVVGTLLVVGAFFWWRRYRRRRVDANGMEPFPSGNKKNAPHDSTGPESRLDLLGGVGGRGVGLTPINTRSLGLRPGDASPTGSDPFLDNSGATTTPTPSSANPLFPPGRSGPTDGEGRTGTWGSSASSPLRGRGGESFAMSGHDSADPLLAGTTRMGGYHSSSRLSTPVEGGTMSTHRPLQLHDPSSRILDEDLDEEGEDDLPDLKRDTLAYLGGGSAPGPSGGGGGDGALSPGGLRNRPSNASAPPGRRRRRGGGDDEREMEYMVHRDAGRVQGAGQGGAGEAGGRRVMELPPRYEELQWEEGERGAETR